MSEDMNKKNPKEKEEFHNYEDDDDCAPDFMEEMMEEARVNPIIFPDGSSTQEILPVEEQWLPLNKDGEYDPGKPVMSQEEFDVLWKSIEQHRREIGSPFATYPNDQDETPK